MVGIFSALAIQCIYILQLPLYTVYSFSLQMAVKIRVCHSRVEFKLPNYAQEIHRKQGMHVIYFLNISHTADCSLTSELY